MKDPLSKPRVFFKTLHLFFLINMGFYSCLTNVQGCYEFYPMDKRKCSMTFLLGSESAL